jgi:DNA mismatch endonuclease (patch repair protein)
MHKCRYGQVKPATNVKFWQDKRRGNVERDKHNLKYLRKVGWKVLIVWECQIRDSQKLNTKLEIFLSS